MKIDQLGLYRGRKAGKTYAVERHNAEVVHRTVRGGSAAMQGSCEYFTACGLDLTPLGTDEEQFLIVMTDEVIERITD